MAYTTGKLAWWHLHLSEIALDVIHGATIKQQVVEDLARPEIVIEDTSPLY